MFICCGGDVFYRMLHPIDTLDVFQEDPSLLPSHLRPSSRYSGIAMLRSIAQQHTAIEVVAKAGLEKVQTEEDASATPAALDLMYGRIESLSNSSLLLEPDNVLLSLGGVQIDPEQSNRDVQLYKEFHTRRLVPPLAAQKTFELELLQMN
jgi:hypothetical protein